MIASEGRLGRIFVLRLQDGDRVPDCIEAYAKERGVESAMCLMLGGAGSGTLVVGPMNPHSAPIEPLLKDFDIAHEILAVGSLFRDESGSPRLHMHAAMGRGGYTAMGCLRKGVEVWNIAEVLMLEITGLDMLRKLDPTLGFEVLTKG